jgi:hypothetical protein
MKNIHAVLSHHIADEFIDIFGLDNPLTISCFWSIEKNIGNSDLTIAPITKQYDEPLSDSTNYLIIAAPSRFLIDTNRNTFLDQNQGLSVDLQIVEILIESTLKDVGFTPEIVKLRRKSLEYKGESVHVIPIDDLREHNENNDGSCWCNPRIEQEENGRVIIHNPLDGREILESLDLKRKDIPNHLALVAKHWLPSSDTDDLNVAIALRWLQKRHKYLTPTLGAEEALTVSLVNYFDTFLRSLIEGD